MQERGCTLHFPARTGSTSRVRTRKRSSTRARASPVGEGNVRAAATASSRTASHMNLINDVEKANPDGMRFRCTSTVVLHVERQSMTCDAHCQTVHGTPVTRRRRPLKPLIRSHPNMNYRMASHHSTKLAPFPLVPTQSAAGITPYHVFLFRSTPLPMHPSSAILRCPHCLHTLYSHVPRTSQRHPSIVEKKKRRCITCVRTPANHHHPD